MNRQHHDLLTKLMYASGEAFGQDELAKLLEVSTRSVRSYLAVINDFLQENGLAPLQVYPNGDVAFTGGQREVLTVQRLLFQSDFYQYRLSSAERRQVLILMMLTGDGFSTSSALTDQLYISKATLIKDMESVECYFAQRGVGFDPARNAGYRLEIDELTRRELLLENMTDIVMRHCFLSGSVNGMTSGTLYGFVMQTFGGLEQMGAFQEAVRQVERDTGIRLNDGEYQNIIHGLAVLLSRLRRRAALPAQWDCGPVRGTAVRFADGLCRSLGPRLGLEFPWPEQRYLAYTLNYRWLDGKEEDPFDTLHVQLATKSFIYAVSKSLGIELFDDNELQSFLSRHLQNLLERTDGRPAPQFPSPQVAIQYQDCYAAMTQNLPILEQTLGHRYTQEEQNAVLLHITAAVERFRRKQGAPKVIVVCNSGVATTKFLAEKLLRSFHIDVVSTTSHHRLREIRTVCRHDFIITTVPLNVDDVPCVWVSPMLNRKDMLQIYDVLATISSPGRIPEATGQKPEPCVSLSDVFTPELVAVDCEADTWQEAIRIAGGLLTTTGEVEESYVEDMIRCVEENGPYIVIVPGVALAHAPPSRPDVPFCASMACFARPVVFHSADNDPVWCVIALPATSQEEHTRQLFQVMRLVCHPEFRKAAMTAGKEGLLHWISSHQTVRKDGTV